MTLTPNPNHKPSPHATKVILFQDLFKILKFSHIVNTFFFPSLTISSVIYFKGPGPGMLWLYSHIYVTKLKHQVCWYLTVLKQLFMCWRPYIYGKHGVPHRPIHPAAQFSILIHHVLIQDACIQQYWYPIEQVHFRPSWLHSKRHVKVSKKKRKQIQWTLLLFWFSWSRG